MYYICVDIGGTSIKYGVLSEKGEIFIDGTISTKVTVKENFILSDVKKLVRSILDEYKKYELHHFKRMQVKPGITGMWQTSGRSNILDFEEVVKLDLKYIEEWSLRLDIKIIFRTILVVLKREGSK